jgi:hypothetical protein
MGRDAGEYTVVSKKGSVALSGHKQVIAAGIWDALTGILIKS